MTWMYDKRQRLSQTPNCGMKLQGLTLFLAVLSLNQASPAVHASALRSQHKSTEVDEFPAAGTVIDSRPEPSDLLPIMPILQGEHDTFPSDADLDPQVLRQLLGENFDPDFTSILKPVISFYNPNGTYEYDFRKSMPVGEMPADIRTLSFTLPGRTKKVKVKSKRNRRRIQRYLATYTYCPVLYRWIDLGQRFWPRWIKSGNCRSPHGRSCSIPAGMTCQPQRSKSLDLLWWHCRTKHRCRWIPLKYPIINKCSCQCRTQSND